jgi:hypothetical protein
MHTLAEVSTWLTRRLPDDWFIEPPEVLADRDEILVVGRLPEPAAQRAQDAARAACIERFREETRDHRMRIARDAEARYRRALSWGAACGDVRQLFTTVSVPAMTRLRFPERAVLDTLIDAGVARSRSDALAWCVRLVGANEAEWLRDLRDAFAHVARVRASGPAAGGADEDAPATGR